MIARVLLALAISAIAAPLSHAASHGVVAAKEYHFRGTPDGSEPDGALLSDGAGNFYGTTSGGGLQSCGLSTPFCGIVFRVNVGTNGTSTETVIYKFQGGNDGASPAGSLIFDHSGNLYGTTVTGGNPAVCNGEGCGTVFKLSPNTNGTWTETVLYRFLGSTDVAQPALGVVMDSAGNLYGASQGGCTEGCNGTIFKLTPNSNGTWTESILYTFLGGSDGGFPAAIVLDDGSIGAAAADSPSPDAPTRVAAFAAPATPAAPAANAPFRKPRRLGPPTCVFFPSTVFTSYVKTIRITRAPRMACTSTSHMATQAIAATFGGTDTGMPTMAIILGRPSPPG